MSKKFFSVLMAIGLICFLSSKSNALIHVNIRFFSDKACEMSILVDEEKNVPRLTWVKDIFIKNSLQLMSLNKINKSKITAKFHDFYRIVNTIEEIQCLSLKEEAMLRGQEEFVEKKYNQLCSLVEIKEKTLNTILINYIGVKQGFLFN